MHVEVRMSASSLFHTVAAATAKALVPITVFVRCTTSFMVSADCKSLTAHSRGQNTVVGQVLWGQTMDAFEDHHGHLKVDSISKRKPMKVAKYILVPVTTRAAEFWTAWSVFTRPSPMPYSRLLQVTKSC